ncbi:hypothetical protein OE647_08450 [Defluviimonas sp. WL0075]|uniref:Uncharacterized protein n=1 Tax=Albidovulum sediminicola TaxID=2984331 RepID=A0ABT2Z0U0_9RHOB|nr:hypothetical protein [Defluviimonas sp. WL0075]
MVQTVIPAASTPAEKGVRLTRREGNTVAMSDPMLSIGFRGVYGLFVAAPAHENYGRGAASHLNSTSMGEMSNN